MHMCFINFFLLLLSIVICDYAILKYFFVYELFLCIFERLHNLRSMTFEYDVVILNKRAPFFLTLYIYVYERNDLFLS